MIPVLAKLMLTGSSDAYTKFYKFNDTLIFEDNNILVL